MIQFILNSQHISTSLSGGSTVLDFVRHHKRLTGTKIGCREGDCGACTILVGDLENNKVIYRSMTSCLMPLINAQGKHIVTIEGINMKELSPVQQALVDTNGTQCGFCTSGFVISLTGFVLSNGVKNFDGAIAAMDGNICRCTGYKSIERAAEEIISQIKDKSNTEGISWLVEHQFIPDYFGEIQNRLRKLKNHLSDIPEKNKSIEQKIIIGGGTDLIVQKHNEIKKATINPVYDDSSLKEIKVNNGFCSVGASVTVTTFSESPDIMQIFSDLKDTIKLISSTPIRNMATIAGNIVNASPIGDMSIFFLALDCELLLNKKGNTRRIKLREFYKGYKQIDKDPEEIVEKIIFKISDSSSHFNFEKVCKRSWLDIASVNTACLMTVGANGIVAEIHLSAGGVAPFPIYLMETCAFLKNKKLSTEVIRDSIKIMHSEISPISDARGSAEYKKLLLRQLFLAHLIKIFGMSKDIRGYLRE